MAMRLFSLYRDMVRRRPFVTQVATAGVLCSVGDILAQVIERRPAGYDLKRTSVMSICGFFYFGPVVSTWLRVLNWLNFPRVAMTVAFDQTFGAPAICAGFVFLHPILSGKSIEEAKNIFKTTYLSILKRGWMLWIPAQSINFYFIPFEFRLLYIQSVAVAWNTFLSYRSNASLTEK